MASTTSDCSIFETARGSNDSVELWADVDNPWFYYDPEFESFCHQKLAELEQLQQGWDGENAPPIDVAIIQAVRRFVDELPRYIATRPMVVPLPAGNVQLEWHHADVVLELEFESADSVHYLKWAPTHRVEEEDVVGASDRAKLVELIRWFMKEMLNER